VFKPVAGVALTAGQVGVGDQVGAIGPVRLCSTQRRGQDGGERLACLQGEDVCKVPLAQDAAKPRLALPNGGRAKRQLPGARKSKIVASCQSRRGRARPACCNCPAVGPVPFRPDAVSRDLP